MLSGFKISAALERYRSWMQAGRCLYGISEEFSDFSFLQRELRLRATSTVLLDPEAAGKGHQFRQQRHSLLHLLCDCHSVKH